MDLRTIAQLANEEKTLRDRVKRWYVDELHPKVVDCKNRQELDALWNVVSRACAGNDGTIRDLPGLLEIEKIFSYDALRQKLDKAIQ